MVDAVISKEEIDEVENALKKLTPVLGDGVQSIFNYNIIPSDNIINDYNEYLHNFETVFTIPPKENSFHALKLLFQRAIPMLRNSLGADKDPSITTSPEIILIDGDFSAHRISITLPIFKNARCILACTITLTVNHHINENNMNDKPVNNITLTRNKNITDDNNDHTHVNHLLENFDNYFTDIKTKTHYKNSESKEHALYVLALNSYIPPKRTVIAYSFIIPKERYDIVQAKYDRAWDSK